MMREVGLGVGNRGGFAAVGYFGGPLAGNAFWRGSPCAGLARSLPGRPGRRATVAATSLFSAVPVAGGTPWKRFTLRLPLEKALNRRISPRTETLH
jgi:hypothetical protein